MRLDAVKILGINVTISSKFEILKEIEKGLAFRVQGRGKTVKNSPKTLTIVTPNPEQVVYAQEDIHFRDILNRADVALPDGTGLVWASRFLSLQPPTSNLQPIPGIDFMESLVSWAARKGLPIALIGSRGGLAVKTLDCLQKLYPKLTGWAVDGPEIKTSNFPHLTSADKENDQYFRELAQRIIDSGVRMVFVGLGAPKQEYFIERLVLSLRDPERSRGAKQSLKYLKDRHVPANAGTRDDKGIVLMSVGGSFDEITGRLPRPPQWVSTVGLKWLWRLILEPWRIKRQLALVKFIWLVIRARLFDKVL